MREAALWSAAGLALRAVYWAATQRVIDSPDALFYLAAGSDFPVNREAITARALPVLYPFLVSCVHLFLPSTELAARLVSLAGSSLAVGLVFVLARRMHGRTAARYAAFITAGMPWLIDYGTRVATEALALPLFVGGVLATAYAARRRAGWAGLLPAGAFFLVHLARPEGTFLLLAAPIGVALGASDRRWRRAGIALFWVAAFLAVQGAVGQIMAGAPIVNNRLSDPAASLAYLRERMDLVLAAASNLYLKKLPLMVGPVLGIFALMGLFGPGRRAVRIERTLAFFMLVQAAIVPLSGYAEPRYLMPVVVGAGFWSARGMAFTARLLARSVPRMRGAPAVLVGVVFGLGLAHAYASNALGPLPALPYEYRIAGEWLGANHPKGLILSRKPQVGYYAGMATTGPASEDSIAEAVQRAQRVNARYLVVDERYTVKLVPGLAPLLDPAKAPASLCLLHAGLSPYPTGRIVLYAVRPAGFEPPSEP